MDLKTLFQKLALENKLSHAYLFWGCPDTEFTLSLANFLENRKWNNPSRPLLDFRMIEPGSQSTGGSAIGINTTKEANRFLWQKPIRSSHKLVVFNPADTLTQQAQNAILKTAEEAPSRAIIILLVKDPALLLPPLVSRLQKIFFPFRSQPHSIEGDAVKFITANIKEKDVIIKEIVSADDNGKRLRAFVQEVMAELDKDPIKNYRPLKELCYRWSLMNRYNTNKKLQLLSWLDSFAC